jgi:hypothetical protein
MKKALLAIAAMLVVGLGCGPSIKLTASWVNEEKIGQGKRYNTVFVAALTSNLEARTTLENDLVQALQARGFKALRSLDYFPLADTPGEKETVLSKVRETGATAILTSAVVNQRSDTRYVPGSIGYAPYGYGGFYGYYRGFYGTMSSPGYYTTDETYYLESHLFDADTEEIMWSAQSEAYNPSSRTKAASQYAALLISQMEKDGLLKK